MTLARLQQKVADLYRDGGTLRRKLSNGVEVVFVVLRSADFE